MKKVIKKKTKKVEIVIKKKKKVIVKSFVEDFDPTNSKGKNVIADDNLIKE